MAKDLVVSQENIITVRGVPVILDSDLAKLYGTETKRLNEQVKRNISRFPSDFMFQLSKEEYDILKSQNATSSWGGRRNLPYAFTELGVSMLSSVLSSETAILANVQIMRAFATMRRFILSNGDVFQRLETIEYKLLESDQKIENLYSKLEEKSLAPKQGIFFDGQVYDSYTFITSLIKSATSRIVLIDNYVDETVLTMLDNRGPSVKASIYTKQISRQLQLASEKHDKQYPAISIKVFRGAHDRFLIIDDKVYHIGASLKDLGGKWFAFSLMEETKAEDLIKRL